MNRKPKRRAQQSGREARAAYATNPKASVRADELQSQDVQNMLFNPVYGYGLVFEPTEVVITQVMQLHQMLAAEQVQRGKTFTLEELGARFQSLFAQLVADEICVRQPDAPPLVSQEQWLRVQQVAIERLMRGEER